MGAVSDRLDQPWQVTLDELVLEGEGGRRDDDALVVQQARDEVGQRLAGAGAGLDEQVGAVDHRGGDGLGHLHLTRALLAAELADRRGQDVAHRVVARCSAGAGGRGGSVGGGFGGSVGHPRTLTAPTDTRRPAVDLPVLVAPGPLTCQFWSLQDR